MLGLPAGVDTARWVRLDSLVKTLHDPTGGILGAMVVRVRDSAVVWKRFPDLRILPASTMKVLTAAAALEDLGPEFRWRTQLWATGPVRGGVLKGDLVLEGGGDPTLGTDGAGMAPLVAAVSRAGIRSIEGSLVALDTLVGRDEAVWPSGWSITNSRDGYGAPVAGLNWAQNRTPARSIAEPRRLALSVLAKSLEARKIRFTGTDTSIVARGDTPPDRRSWQLVGKVQSPKLSEVLRICLVHSVNPYAEAAVLAMGARKPASRYSVRDQGVRRSRQILTLLSVPGAVFVDDGSGLSRYDLVTARAMAELLRRDLGRPEGLRVTDLMAVGGQGTLRFRFGTLPDPSWVVAKTGTLNGTSALVGVLRVPGKDTLAFALLSTGYQGSARAIRGFQDRMLMALAGIAPTARPDTATPSDADSPDDEEPAATDSAIPSVPDSSSRAPGPDSLPVPVAPKPAPDSSVAPSAPLREDSAASGPVAPVAGPAITVPVSGIADSTARSPSRATPDTARRDEPRALAAPDSGASRPSGPAMPAEVDSSRRDSLPASSGSRTDSVRTSSAGLPDTAGTDPATPPDTGSSAPMLPSGTGIAIDSASPSAPRFDSLIPHQTTPAARSSEPVRDSGSPIVPPGTDPDKVNP